MLSEYEVFDEYNANIGRCPVAYEPQEVGQSRIESMSADDRNWDHARTWSKYELAETGHIYSHRGRNNGKDISRNEGQGGYKNLNVDGYRVESRSNISRYRQTQQYCEEFSKISDRVKDGF